MITPRIETALINNIAQLRTHTSMFAGVTKIFIPDGHFAIITDVKVFPFNNLKGAEDLEIFSVIDAGCINIFDFWMDRANTVRKSLIVRNNYHLNRSPILPANETYIINGDPVHFDTYMIFDRDIYITILNHAGVWNASGIRWEVLKQTQLHNAPASYGNTVETLTELTDITGKHYRPVGNEEMLQVLSSDQDMQPRPAADSNSQIGDPSNINRNWNLPVFWVQYVIISDAHKAEVCK